LNYDNAIELAATSANIDCDIGIKANVPGVAFNEHSPISLAKLHGSVNWRMDSDSLIEVHDQPTGNAALIFGAGNKLRVEGPYLDLLLSFRDRLNSTRCLEICGYSFRDRHVNHIIRTWLSRHDDARLVIVDPYISQETIAENIDSTLDGGTRVNRTWLFKRLELKALSVEEWCINITA
jgi:SIR2-like domain